MNVVFHGLAAIGLTHVVLADRPPTKATYAAAAVLGVLSHGILDGLPHQYPLRASVDIVAAIALVGVVTWKWMPPSHRLLLGWTFAFAVLPDVIDLGPAMVVHAVTGDRLHQPHLFPWHWPEGSGSIFDNTKPWVSTTNHVIVVTFAVAAVVFGRRRLPRSGPTLLPE